MRTNVVINDQYLYLKEDIESIPKIFPFSGTEIKMLRNETKIFFMHGCKMVVKRFKKITAANRLIFANTSRYSKAHRAYAASSRLLKIGLLSPDPIAYIDIFDNMMLKDCYYICKYVEYDSLENLFKKEPAEYYSALKPLGELIYTLHENRVFLGDLHLGNILYDKVNNHYDFYIIDNNRFFIKRDSRRNRIRNFDRLELTDDQLKGICDEYARLSNCDNIKLQEEVKAYRERHITFVEKKHAIKRLFSLNKKA